MEKNNKVKLNSIEAFRFLFMLQVCIWHYKMTNVFAHGYMAVEFFFILSGVLMFFSANKENALGTFDYTIKKVKRFAPDCLLLIAYVNLRHMILPALLGKKELDVSWLLQAIPESLFLQNTGIYAGGVNFQMWYVSVLLWGGAFVYALLRYNKKLAVSVILPMVVVVGYTYIFLLTTTLKFAISSWLDLLLFSIVCVGLSAFFKWLISKIVPVIQGFFLK